MRDIKLLTIIMLFTIPVFWPVLRESAFCEESEEGKISAPVSFTTIEAEIKKYNDEDEKKGVEYDGYFDDELKKNLRSLSRQKGYNYFRIVRSEVLTVTNRKNSDYLLVSGRNYFVKSVLKSVKKWKDRDEKEHTIVSLSGMIVQRKKVRDEKGKEKTVENKVASFKFDRETGRYFILLWQKFFKVRVGEDEEKTTDLILAISPGK